MNIQEWKKKLLEIINHYEIQDKVIIQSFSEESLQKDSRLK